MTPTPEDVRFAFFTGIAVGVIFGLLASLWIRRGRKKISRAYRAALKPVKDERSSIAKHFDIIGRDLK